MKLGKKGFTLIELLVVIAIIGGLAAMLLPNYMIAREKARDAQRRSDLTQIQKALELYRQDTSTPIVYPTGLPSCNTSLTGSSNTYMSSVPCDPADSPTTKKYGYSYDNSNLTFSLCACLESPTTNDTNDCSASACSSWSSCASGKCVYVHQD